MAGPAPAPRHSRIAPLDPSSRHDSPASLTRRRRASPPALALAVVAFLASLLSFDGPVFAGNNPPAWRTDRLLIQPRAGTRTDDLQHLHAVHGARLHREFSHFGGLQTLELPPGAHLDQMLAAYRASALIEAAEPDYVIRVSTTTPNDPAVADGSQWHLGIASDSGNATNANLHAPAGWDLLHDASDVVVAIVDSGIRATHQDLAANLWVNSSETAGNGIDDDRDGYVDDLHGINAITGSGDPVDDLGHGSHVAGIVGAVGNNAVGGAGVAWKVRLMACKFIGAGGEGSSSDAIECLDYARTHGARIVNCSWGNTATSTILRNAFQRLRDAGILVVAATGNDARNNDTTPEYPAAYSFDNLVAVVATTRSDGLADFSNYGATTADLGAPGVEIYSTWYTADDAYSTQTGTSMAAPMVSGILALVRARFPGETPAQLIERLYAAADPVPGLTGRCVTGGRANLARALADTVLADFTASVLHGPPPLTVQFTNTTRGPAASQVWSFGDGSTSTELSPVHVFESEGTFGVRLAVTGTDGQVSSKTRAVTVAGNYTPSAGTYAWVDASTLPALALTDNGVSAALNLPFGFVYYGRPYDAVFVGANGTLGFQADGLSAASNTTLPSTAAPNAALYPYWDNLNPAAGGSVRAGTVGAAPQRRFVASWENVPLNPGGLRLTFQAILEEGTGRIRFQYQQVQPQSPRGGGRGATVGIEDPNGLVAVLHLLNGSPITLTNLQAIVFEPSPTAAQADLQLAITDPTSPVLQLHGPRSTTCQVEVSSDLEEWNPLTTVSLDADGIATVGASALGSTGTQRFYRALLLP